MDAAAEGWRARSRYNECFPKKNSTMRVSHILLSTLKEAPAEAELVSHA